MRMIEANLFPVIPYLHVQDHNREVTSMSDYAHNGRRPRISVGSRTLESRLMFSACYLLFLLRAVVTRLMPWREQAFFRKAGTRGSIFSEANSAAGVMVASSFMGL